MRKLTGFFTPLEHAGADYWVPVFGLVILAVGLAYLIACKFKPKDFKPRVDPLPLDLDPCQPLPPMRVEAKNFRMPFTFVGECGICGLEHGSDAKWDGNKQACIDALLSKMPKRGEHGRFEKRP